MGDHLSDAMGVVDEVKEKLTSDEYNRLMMHLKKAFDDTQGSGVIDIAKDLHFWINDTARTFDKGLFEEMRDTKEYRAARVAAFNEITQAFDIEFMFLMDLTAREVARELWLHLDRVQDMKEIHEDFELACKEIANRMLADPKYHLETEGKPNERFHDD